MSIISNVSIVLTGFSNYIFNGGTGITWVLPNVSTYQNSNYFVKNRGSGSLTITGTFPNQLYSFMPINSFIINSGEAYIFNSDGTYWEVN